MNSFSGLLTQVASARNVTEPLVKSLRHRDKSSVFGCSILLENQFPKWFKIPVPAGLQTTILKARINSICKRDAISLNSQH
jgi:hypothetical protein